MIIPFEGINLSDSYIALKNKHTEKRGVLNYLTNKNVLPFIYDGIDFMNDSYIVARRQITSGCIKWSRLVQKYLVYPRVLNIPITVPKDTLGLRAIHS